MFIINLTGPLNLPVSQSSKYLLCWGRFSKKLNFQKRILRGGGDADQTNDMVCISHKRSHFLNYEKKSDSEAVKKGERSVNQIENKGEDLYPLGDGIV